MELDLESLSAEDFNRHIRRQVAEVARLRSAVKAAERKLAWLREGRDLYIGPEPSPSTSLKLTTPDQDAAAENGKPPTSLTEAITRVIPQGVEMRGADIVEALLARNWIDKRHAHTASSMLSNLTARGRLERVDRGIYRLPEANRSEEP